MRLRCAGLVVALAASIVALVPAAAQIGIGEGLTIAGDATVVTDYRFRGVSRSDEDIAVQGGIEMAHDSGFYAGAWGSSLGGGLFGDAELNGYGGWSGEVASGFRFDVGLRYYAFAGCDEALGDDDYVEPRASISYSIGPAELTTGAAYAVDALGDGDNVYVYSDVAVGVPLTAITLTGHVGYSDGPLALQGDGEAIDWSLGAEYVRGPVTFGLSYVDTDGEGDLVDATVVGSVGVRF